VVRQLDDVAQHRSTWPPPFFGSDKRTSRSPAASSPTRSWFWIAARPRQAQKRDAACRSDQAPKPAAMPAETSSANTIVRSRSSTKRLTIGRPTRAVTFQSTVRGSSPSTYSRTSLNSTPAPRNVDRKPPASTSVISRPERTSVVRTQASTSARRSRGSGRGFGGRNGIASAAR